MPGSKFNADLHALLSVRGRRTNWVRVCLTTIRSVNPSKRAPALYSSLGGLTFERQRQTNGKVSQIKLVAGPRNQIRPLTQKVSGRLRFALIFENRPWKHCGSKRERNPAKRFRSIAERGVDRLVANALTAFNHHGELQKAIEQRGLAIEVPLLEAPRGDVVLSVIEKSEPPKRVTCRDVV